jgi:hypothetical protein
VAPPTELYATSDIRFVTLEIGKLTTKVDRLIADVDKQSGKINSLEKAVDRFKWTAAVVVFIAIAVWALFGEMIKERARAAMAGPAVITTKQ